MLNIRIENLNENILQIPLDNRISHAESIGINGPSIGYAAPCGHKAAIGDI
jgi:hypothetical protein